MQSDTAAATEAMRHGASPVAGALAVGLLAVVAGAVAILADARASGISYWGTSGVYLLGFPACTLALTAIGWRIHRRSDPVVARWVFATGASVLAYLVTVALVTRLVAVEGQSGALTSWIGLFALGSLLVPPLRA